MKFIGRLIRNMLVLPRPRGGQMKIIEKILNRFGYLKLPQIDEVMRSVPVYGKDGTWLTAIKFIPKNPTPAEESDVGPQHAQQSPLAAELQRQVRENVEKVKQ